MRYSEVDDDSVLQDLSEKFDKFRIEKRLKDEEIAARAGVSRQTISDFRAGRRNISLKIFIRLLRSIDCLDRMEQLFPPSDTYSPLEVREIKPPKRVRNSRQNDAEFVWGDEK